MPFPSLSTRHRGRLLAIITTALMLGTGAALAADVAAPGADKTAVKAEAPFLAENDAAMSSMMDGMAIKPSGDVDRDFVGMMAPHHQGAIAMAQAELRHGHNEALRRIAQEIIVEQQQEIAAMQLALGQPLPPSAAAPDQVGAAPLATGAMQPGMSMAPAR